MDGTKKLIKQACVGTLEECFQADQKGADRVELCSDLSVGGITPSFEEIKEAATQCQCLISVMIRPRGGDFVYSEEEITLMKKEIEYCKQQKVDGVVFGCLTQENQVNLEQNKELVTCSAPLKTTFHMAFDQIDNKSEALSQLMDLGFSRVLTKGCKTQASDGKEVLKNLVKQAGEKISIMSGGGITYENYQEIVDYTHVYQVHGKLIVGPLQP